jgi:hypothetical protein
MTRLAATFFAVAFLFAPAVAVAQESEVPEQLKPYGPLLGTWRYEGPLLETVPDFGKKGEELVFQFTWRRVLDKNVVAEDWLSETEGGKKFSGKALIGWNAAEKKLSYRSMDSAGGMTLGTIVFDKQAKSSTLTEKGIDGEGKETKFKGVVIRTGKDTLTWQALERTKMEGASPVYEFKRVKWQGGKK